MSRRDLSPEERARQRVKKLKSFYGNLTSFVIVNAFLYALDIWGDGVTLVDWLTFGWIRHLDWAYWVTFGWGIGLAIDAANIFLPFHSKEWEERKLREFLAEEQGRSLD